MTLLLLWISPLLFTIPAGIVEYIGYLGSFLTSVTFIPQVYKSWKSRSVGDLSVWMVGIVIFSTLVWLVYGWAISSRPVIVANMVVLLLSLLLLYFKFSFRRHAAAKKQEL